MNHNEYREKLPLLFYGELDNGERKELELHLDECIPCSQELEQLEKIQSTMDAANLPKTSEHLLNEARMELRAALRIERSRKTWKDIWTERLQGWFPAFRISFAALASLAFGIFIGYKAIRPAAQPPAEGTRASTSIPVSDSQIPHSEGEMRITNVKFEDADATDGNVEFTFEAIRPMRYKGSINDPNAQKVLTYALVNEQNPGIRLHAANALNARQLGKPDPAVKSALIQALRDDENTGVRMEALTALQRFEKDEEIKQAILHVLVTDTNPGLRIAAIKSIEAEGSIDHEVVKVLKEVQTDDEEYIRLSAKKMIQEVSRKQ
ncbi:MAG TPA: HEAT repeat domain-containing protein [Anaerolineales bacterium]|nr:HEAT repeat domain-containing protein [Anaerolineales bacterium]